MKREKIRESDSKRQSGNADRNDSEDGRSFHESTTLGWRPTCGCSQPGAAVPHEPIPCVVFDPFMGAGTTALVAWQQHRRYIGCELSAEYIAIAEKRITDAKAEFPMFEMAQT